MCDHLVLSNIALPDYKLQHRSNTLLTVYDGPPKYLHTDLTGTLTSHPLSTLNAEKICGELIRLHLMTVACGTYCTHILVSIENASLVIIACCQMPI